MRGTVERRPVLCPDCGEAGVFFFLTDTLRGNFDCPFCMCEGWSLGVCVIMEEVPRALADQRPLPAGCSYTH